MMLEPKGIKYWTIDEDGRNTIRDDAPEWAKIEFEEYQEDMKQEPDEDGVIKVRIIM
ncbi:hypothetical protein NHG23_05325 [Aerococcaceae bacterium NML190073]|nr:hypothetical protein [Aerococcaceae bacterium NML190073]